MRAWLAGAALLAVGCGSAGGGRASSFPAATLTVRAANGRFSPSRIAVTAGEKVTWRNEDALDHTVTSGADGDADGLFDALLHPGQTLQVIFTSPGEYPYFSRAEGMSGSVEVVAAPAAR